MTFCAAPDCKNSTKCVGRHVGISLHKFPLKKKSLLRQWMQHVGRTPWTPNECSRLCSEHFTSDCFEESVSDKLTKLGMLSTQSRRGGRRLKPNAVPTIFTHQKLGTLGLEWSERRQTAEHARREGNEMFDELLKVFEASSTPKQTSLKGKVKVDVDVTPTSPQCEASPFVDWPSVLNASTEKAQQHADPIVVVKVEPEPTGGFPSQDFEEEVKVKLEPLDNCSSPGELSPVDARWLHGDVALNLNSVCVKDEPFEESHSANERRVQLDENISSLSHCAYNTVSCKQTLEVKRKETRWKNVCCHCSYSSKSKIKLRDHLRTHMGEIYSFKCTVCDRAFKTANNLKTHQKIHTRKKRYKCFACTKACISSYYLKMHVKIHKAKRPFKCTVCEKEFRISSELKAHEKCHTDNRPFKCSLCEKAFKALVNLKVHEMIHTGERPFKCSVCDKAFRFSSELKIHEKRHTDERPFRCSFCEKAFTISSELKIHKMMHTGERPCKCSVCDKGFRTSSQRSAHEKTHTDERPVKCSFCDKAFRTLKRVKEHEKIHSDEKPFKCPFCDKAFKRLSYLKLHVNIHDGTRPFKCSICQKAFITSSSLKMHERIHTGERPHKCSVCEKAFVTSYNRRMHEIIHTRKKFKCLFCGEAFVTPASLITHEKIHTDETPYRCSVCRILFKTLNHLLTHMQTHNEGKTFLCFL